MKDFLLALFSKFWWTIVLILILLYGISKIQSCNPIIPIGPGLNPFKPVASPVVTPATIVTPSKNDQANVPVGNIIKEVIIPKHETTRPQKGYVEKERILVSVDPKCNTCIAHTSVLTTYRYFGFDFEPKLYMGIVQGKGILGYDQGIIRYTNFTFDWMFTFPYTGPMIGYNITNNLSALAGANIKYLNCDDCSVVKDLKLATSIDLYPAVGIGFAF